MLSIIIPVYNEEHVLKKNEDYFRILSESGEVIFVDGGSTDNTVKIANTYGRVIKGQKNRAQQMNCGAKAAQFDIYLFLHADTILHEGSEKMIQESIKDNGYIGGCFCQDFDQPELIYKWIAWTGNIRAKMSKIFYGDQGIFVRKDMFWKCEGFPETKICEDVLFTKKLRKLGKVEVLNQPIHCSTRRWTQQGLWKTFFLNTRIRLALLLKRDLNKLSFAYKDIRL